MSKNRTYDWKGKVCNHQQLGGIETSVVDDGPGRQEVQSTTLVVIATSIFFGFYLWGLDLVFSRILSLVLKR